MAPLSYTQFVLSQKPRNPSLSNLCHFLSHSTNRKSCNITCLDFTNADEPPSRRDFGVTDLKDLLEVLATVNQSRDISKKTSQPQGHILFVEDLTKELVEILGSQLDIDPFFFASHIHGPTATAQTSKPASVILPSEIANQSFLSLQYHRVLEFGKETAALRRLSSDGNIPRKVMLLPIMQDTRIGLVQQSCSVFLTSTRNGWLGLILLDAPVTSTYRSSKQELCLHSEPFQGGIEHFLERPSYSDKEPVHLIPTSLLEDLIFFWSKARPPSFELSSPSLLCMTYYPLKIVAAEWVRYAGVLSLCMKHYEYLTGANLDADVFAKLDSDLHDLQAWIRRCMQTLQKLQYITDFIELQARSGENKESSDMLLKDYQHITALVKTYSLRLEAAITFVTSLVQIVDSRESLREASNVRRLTNLALVFIPLSFVTGLFSMNDGVSAHGLVLFFSVAVPLCAVVLCISCLPKIRVGGLFRRLGRVKNARNIEAL